MNGWENLMEDKLNKFFLLRDEIITEYSAGRMSKKDFLIKNYNHMKKGNLKPFFTIDSYEKGIFNYQYFNSIAKYYKMMASNIKGRSKKKEYYIEKMTLYYQKKDFSILKLLEYLNYHNTEAYYINTDSKFLDNKLFEIVLKDYEFAIFHSKSKWLFSELKKAGIFKKEKRNSLIDEYINKKYWNESL